MHLFTSLDFTMDSKLLGLVLFGVFLTGVSASECQSSIPQQCLSASTSHLAAASIFPATQALQLCRFTEQEMELVSECVDTAVADHCSTKAALLGRLRSAAKLCKAAKECRSLPNTYTKVHHRCFAELRTTVETLGDICRTLRGQLRCVFHQLAGCPAIVAAIRDQYEDILHPGSVVCPSASLAVHSHNARHRISRRDADCTSAATSLLRCTRTFLRAILSQLDDASYICRITRDYMINCIGANTRNCPELRRSILTRISSGSSADTIRRECGDDIFNMDGGRDQTISSDDTFDTSKSIDDKGSRTTTPSWHVNCDIQNVKRCTPEYYSHFQRTMKEIASGGSISSIKQTLQNSTDYQNLCRTVSGRDATIRQCLNAALRFCTDPQIQETYYTSMKNLLDFCRLLHKCPSSSRASVSFRQCFGNVFDEQVKQGSTPSPCSYLQDLTFCLDRSYAICPEAHDYIRQNTYILGGSLLQLKDQCPGFTPDFQGSIWTKSPSPTTGVTSGASSTEWRGLPGLLLALLAWAR